MTPEEPFRGKVALVTGGAGGLGRRVTLRLLEFGAAAVVVASRDRSRHRAVVEQAAAFAGDVESIELDVRDPDRNVEVFEDVARRHGRLDAVVLAAAGNFLVPSIRLKPKGWRAVLDIALSGVFYGCQAAARAMRDRGGGAICTIGATYAWTGMPGVVHSAAAKAGVLALTRTLAVEWAPLGIRVNCVAPGPFESEGAGKNLWPTEELRRRVARSVPTGRFVDVDEVAGAVCYLLSDSASSITGECLVVDGGAWLGKGLFAQPGDEAFERFARGDWKAPGR